MSLISLKWDRRDLTSEAATNALARIAKKADHRRLLSAHAVEGVVRAAMDTLSGRMNRIRTRASKATKKAHDT